MSNSILMGTFLTSLLGILGILGGHVSNLRKEKYIRIQTALKKNEENELKNTQPEPAIVESPEIKKEVKEVKEPQTTSREVQDFINRAEVFLARKETEEAERLFIKVLAFNPNHPLALQKLAYIYLENKAYQKAESMYRQLIDLAPQNASVYTNLGLTLFHQKKFDECVESYKTAVSLEPNNAERYINLGEVYKTTQEVESAIEAFECAVRKDGRNIKYLYLLAELCADTMRLDMAKKWYDKILHLSPYDEKAKEEMKKLERLGF